MTNHVFSVAEFEARITRVRDELSHRELDGILVSDPANIYYLTGYNAWSFYTPQALYLPLEGEPVLMMREMDGLGAHRTAALGADQVIVYPERTVHRPDEHPFTFVADELISRGVIGGVQRIAYEGDAHFFSVRAFQAFTAACPSATFVESRELVNWVRLVKSDAEIALMRQAGKVASGAMAAGIEALAAGVPQYELAATIMAAQARGADANGGDYPAIVPMFPSGEGADTPHLTWTSAPVRTDEAVSIELAGVQHRYHAPLARTVSIGTPTRELDRLAKVTVEGLNATLDAIRPGVTPRQVLEAWNRVLRAHGLEKRSRLGYSIGIGYPPDWGERTVSLRADDETVLQENMTFHVIAGMWMTGFGFEVSESLRISQNGVEIFTDAPRELILRGK